MEVVHLIGGEGIQPERSWGDNEFLTQTLIR